MLATTMQKASPGAWDCRQKKENRDAASECRAHSQEVPVYKRPGMARSASAGFAFPPLAGAPGVAVTLSCRALAARGRRVPGRTFTGRCDALAPHVT
jgi:hypothetical protein